MSNYERDAREPTAEVLKAIARLGWSPTWLLTGEGPERLRDPEDSDHAGDIGASIRTGASSSEAIAKAVRKVTKPMEVAFAEVEERMGGKIDDFAFVPYLQVRLGAGSGQVVESEQIVAWMAFRKTYLQVLGVPTSSACLVRVRGDSMDPDLKDGDTVLIDTSDTKVHERKRAFAFREEGTDELLVKHIRLDGDSWHITGSDHWGERTLGPEDQKPLVIGRVRWSGRTWD